MQKVKLKDLFHIEYGNQLDLNKLEISDTNDGINFVSRQSYNLGVSCKVFKNEKFKLCKKGCITVTLGGSYLLSSFIQEEDFYTGQNIKVLTPKFIMSDLQKYFYCYAIMSNRYRYTSHGREANKTLDDLLVPSIDEIPEWVYQLKAPGKPTELSCHDKKISLQDREWKWFQYQDIFDIEGTKTTSLNDLELHGEGLYPYVTTQAVGNGIAGFYHYKTEEGNVICVDSAVVGYCSYQAKDFSASDHVEKLHLKNYKLNKYIAIFLLTLCNLEQYRYSYGRKRSQSRLKQEKIKLPVDNNNNPDWQFMEDYIKSLPYSKNL